MNIIDRWILMFNPLYYINLVLFTYILDIELTRVTFLVMIVFSVSILLFIDGIFKCYINNDKIKNKGGFIYGKGNISDCNCKDDINK